MKINSGQSLIAIEGIEVHAYHGVYKNERTKGNTYLVDVYLQTDIERAAETDDLHETVDYFEVYKLVLELMEKPVHLLEHLSSKIASAILEQFSNVLDVKLRVSKVQPWAMDQCVQTYVEMKVSRN